MERKAPLSPISRNKNASKAPESGTPRAGNQLVRMRSPVQIWIAAPKNSRNRLISGVFVLLSLKIMWVRKWVNRTDPQLDPHGEMRGKVQRAPDRKFGFPARCFYITCAMKLPMASAAWSCICRVA